MNLIEEFKKNQSGDFRGIPFGKGLESINRDTNGILPKKIYGIAGPEKSGKTTFADAGFLYQPFLYCLEHNIKIEWIYYSFEIDRVSKEFECLAHFLNVDKGVNNIYLPEGVTKNGLNKIELSADYIRGLVLDDNFNQIKFNEDLIPLMKEVYANRVIPLFGEYSAEGIKIQDGLISFRSHPENPTGIYKEILEYANQRGRIIYRNPEKRHGIIRYEKNDPSAYVIVIIDHIRKVRGERGYDRKTTIDKMSEYLVELRDSLGYTFVPLMHTNRNLGSIERLSFMKGDLYPTSNDLKDSGNLAEDCNFLLTTFNPNDDLYGLKEHFGLKIRDSRGNILNEKLKTIHLASSRHGPFPKHYKMNMLGNVKNFEKII